MAETIILDFTNVKDRGGVNPKHQPPGDYRGKVISAEITSSNNNNKMVVFVVQSVDMPSATYAYRCIVEKAEQLWKIRNMFVAAGMNVPKKKIKVDPAKIVGKEIGMSLDDHEYEGKMSSEITDVFPASDLPEDEVDEPPVKKAAAKSTKSSSKAAEPEDDDDEDEDEELDELDIDDL